MNDEALLALMWEAVTSDKALVELLARLAASFGCHSAALVYKDTTTPAADISAAYGPLADATLQRRYALKFAALDPAPAAMGRIAVGDVADTDSLFSEADRCHYRAFLEGFYYPLDLGGALGAPLCKERSRIGMIAVHRIIARRPFDAAGLRRLVPHLARMIELRQLFFALDGKLARMHDALDPVAAAVMILDAHGVLTEANAAARSLFAIGDGLILSRDGRVLARNGDANRVLRMAYAGDAAEHIVRIPRGAGVSPLVLRLLRREDPPGWTVLASPPGSEDGPSAQALAAALGLSATAADLLAALLRGSTLNAFCAQRQMSRNTAKYHLRAAFDATGMRRQADLLRHAATVVQDLAL